MNRAEARAVFNPKYTAEPDAPYMKACPICWSQLSEASTENDKVELYCLEHGKMDAFLSLPPQNIIRSQSQ